MTIFSWNGKEWVDGGEAAKTLLLESIGLMIAEHNEEKVIKAIKKAIEIAEECSKTATKEECGECGGCSACKYSWCAEE